MSQIDLRQLLREVEDNAGADTFVGVTIPGVSGTFLARDEASRVCVLVEEKDHAAGAPIETRHLQVVFGLAGRVVLSGKSRNGIFTLLRCSDAGTELQGHFLDAIGMLLPHIASADGDAKTIRELVQSLLEMFRAVDEPARDTIQGLWGELFVIRHAHDPAQLLRVWHTDPNELFDFSKHTERVEVKTSLGQRRHHFGLSQVRSEHLTVTVVSVVTEAIAGGVSVEQLLDEIASRLMAFPDLQLRLRSVAAQALGRDWQYATKYKFDAEAARRSRAAYDAASIPSVATPVPEEVSQVTFVSDLTNVRSLTRKEIEERGPLAQTLSSVGAGAN